MLAGTLTTIKLRVSITSLTSVVICPETDISVDSTTAKVKSKVETKKKRKSQPETSTEKQNLAKKQSKDIRSFFTPSKENKSNNQTRKTEPSKNSVIDLTE